MQTYLYQSSLTVFVATILCLYISCAIITLTTPYALQSHTHSSITLTLPLPFLSPSPSLFKIVLQ